MKGNAALHYIKYLLGVEKPETQTTSDERALLGKYATNVGSAVEIGVFEGVNTVTIAKAISKEGNLYAIDPFFKGKLGVSYHELISRSHIRRSKVLQKVTLLPFFSFDAVERVPGSVDFIFIDGDHSYDGIKRDWEDWSKKLSKGGIIALHDTSVPKHDSKVAELGSFKFYNEVISKDQQFEHLECVDSLNILKKLYNHD